MRVKISLLTLMSLLEQHLAEEGMDTNKPIKLSWEMENGEIGLIAEIPDPKPEKDKEKSSSKSKKIVGRIY